MAQDPGLAGAVWALPSCCGGELTTPCRSCPKSRGLRLEASKVVFAQFLVFWSLSHPEWEQFFGILQHQSHTRAQAF